MFSVHNTSFDVLTALPKDTTSTQTHSFTPKFSTMERLKIAILYSLVDFYILKVSSLNKQGFLVPLSAEEGFCLLLWECNCIKRGIPRDPASAKVNKDIPPK